MTSHLYQLARGHFLLSLIIMYLSFQVFKVILSFNYYSTPT